MYSFFALLFQKSYWLMLFRKATWYEAWLSLKRAHKDRRARKHLGRFALSLFIPVLCATYLGFLVGTGAIFIVPFIFLIIWWRTREAKKEAAVSLSLLQPPAPVHRELSSNEKRHIHAYFAELTLIYAVMTDRAGSESFLREKVLPEGFEVVSRRVHLDLLKSRGLWDKMSSLDRQAMMMADGHWEWARINQIALNLESLRLLRWILRIDFYLPTIGQQIRLDYKLANEIVHAPGKLLEGDALATQEMMEIGRDSARHFLIRCIAEEITRGYREVAEGESLQWAKDITDALSGKQHEDFVIEGKLVSEVSREQLEWATMLARTRMNFLTWTISVLDNPVLPTLNPEPEEVPGVESSSASAIETQLQL